MAIRVARLLPLLFTLFFVTIAQSGCKSTFGAEDADPFSVESAGDAMEDEEQEDVWESINR